MTSKTATVQDLAREAGSWFERKLRDGNDSESAFVSLKDGRPDWVQELVYEAHGDFGPDDWRYECIEAALDAIADGQDPDDGSEFADQHVDVYTSRRLAWLASNLNRPSYCTEAQDEGLAAPDADVVDLAGLGQYMEALEVFGIVAQQLEAHLEEIGE